MSRKRPKLVHGTQEETSKNEHANQPSTTQEQHADKLLIPGLPDHIAQLCLSKIHPSTLYSVCPLWRRLIYSPCYPSFPTLYALLTPTTTPTSQLVTPIHFSTYDPISARWRSLTPPPDPPLELLLHHPSFISRNLPIQSVTASDRLVVVAATSQHLHPALPRPLVFDPLARAWYYGPDIPVPRRWCAVGAVGASVYVASGVGSHFATDTARSVEKWDLNRGRSQVHGGGCWDKVRPLRDGRFSREAVDAVGCKGQLCMVNVKGFAPKQGAVYDVENDTWDEMKEGMVAGWRGPAAAMDEEVIYAVDESRGVLRRYDDDKDVWVDVLACESLCGAQQMAAGGGRICVVCRSGREIVVVDVVAAPAKMWVVRPPMGFNAVALHILPRMNMVDFRP